MATFPSLFVSHGSPMMALEDSRARRFLIGLGDDIRRPDAIIIASAHWEPPHLAFTTAERLPTIHDFGGFPQALFDCRYEPPGAPAAISRAAGLLKDVGMDVYADPVRGVDHGAWVPLMLMYPGGNITHNLREMNRAEPDGEGHDWVVEFADWVADALVNGPVSDLIDWENTAPHARRSHPSDEHFLPLFTALGAGGPDASVERIHSSYSYGSLAMDMYSFF